MRRISYDPLKIKMVKMNIKVKDLINNANISKSSYYKIKNNENVSTNTLEKICNYLNCEISEVVECVDDKYEK
ncbi:helix-turn-helix domain-containing protein [Oceanivirga miroungae]|uniref:HTH cro/C1-type domain-containing protein n=1 Tax=Oceanivirga miroungae TaxID=1130046 RepID=A0A6I8MCI2_9FUSO|nr:helix-turn-helix transcriptional regulator [Oceanivirga miroungae]VWL85956.1 hypothetical protein OMES3154_01247 [Oceanivirga miroungae]